jgi:hypothetical protein
MVVAFRQHALLPLNDCLYALLPTNPHLTRSASHRCLQRHGISHLPDAGSDKPKRQRFKRYPIGFFHMDIAEVQTSEGKLYLCAAIDRTSKFAVTQLVEKANRRTAYSRQMRFDMICGANGIEHRLTKPPPPLDQRPSRADEPNDQRGNRETLPLR